MRAIAFALLVSVTVAMEAVGDKIRLNSQGWKDARVIGERQSGHGRGLKGQLYLLPEHRPAKFERIDSDGLHEAGYGPDDFDERPGNRLALRRCIGRHA
jgi:hypothetical protein